MQSVLELFYLRVPAGTRDGEVLDIEKMGHTGLNGGRSGDLHCTVNIVADQSHNETTQQGSSINQLRQQRRPMLRRTTTMAWFRLPFQRSCTGWSSVGDDSEGEVTISIPVGALPDEDCGSEEGEMVQTI